MIYRIYNQDVESLLERPETGMGYQVVQARKHNSFSLREFVIYNSELAVDLDSDFELNKRRIYHLGYSEMLNGANEIMFDYTSIKVQNNEMIVLSSDQDAVKIIRSFTHERKIGGVAAIDSPKENASGYETFVRTSAFENDRRIDFDKKKLKPGSFTTTLIDYKACVDTKDDPVDRYALPNDDKIKWSFYIKPTSDDVLQRGTVQPAFEHLGGGIEAYFDKGTSIGTYFDKREYGK